MRRTTQRALIQLSVFGTFLSLLLYLNRSPSDKKILQWITIRYKTTSKVPEARGICPGLREQVDAKPALIVSRVAADGDMTWFDELKDKYHLCIYTVDTSVDTKSEYLQVPANRGHEAMAYLTFLIDNYKHIPAAGAVFVHGSRWAWHNDAPDYDNAALLHELNVSAALEPWGYHNLRCDWSASTCPSSSASQRSFETTMRAALEPWNLRAISDAALPYALTTLFGQDRYASENSVSNHLLGRNNAVRAQCCAQFVLARESAWQHSRDEYVALRQWLLDSGSVAQNNAVLRDDRVAGRILSYIWHILFIQHSKLGPRHSPSIASDGINLGQLNAASCPSAEECYCRLYNRCGLRGCMSPDRCRGQYRVPPGFKLPENWVATHT